MSDQRHLMVADEECGTYHETGRSSPVSRWVYGISAGLAVAAVATLVIFKSGAAAVASDQMRPQELFAKEHLVKSCPAGHFHQCPSEWKAPGNASGYHCLHKLARQTSQKAYESSGGACRPAKEGPFPFDDCQDQCGIGATVPAHGSHHSVVHHFHHYQGHHGTWGHSSHGSHWGSSYHGSPYYHGSHWGSSYHGSPYYHGSHWGSSYYGSPYYHDASTPALAGDEQYKEWKDSLSDDTQGLAGDEQYKEWKDSLSDDTPALAGDEQYKEWKDSLSDDTQGLAGDEQYKEWKDSLSDDTPALAGDEQYKEWKDSLSDDTPALAGDEQYKQWKDSLSVDYPTTDSHTVIHHHYVAPLHSAHYYGGHGYSYGGSGYHDGSYYDDLGHSHGYSYSSGDALPPGYDSTYGGSYGGSYSHGGSYGSHHFSGSYGHGSGSYHYRHHSYHSSKENGIYSCAPHDNQCPADWKGKGNAGGYHCLHQLAKQTSRKAYLKSGGACRPAAQGPFQHSDCKVQCRIGGHARVLVDTKKEGLKIKDPSKKKGLKISEK